MKFCEREIGSGEKGRGAPNTHFEDDEDEEVQIVALLILMSIARMARKTIIKEGVEDDGDEGKKD